MKRHINYLLLALLLALYACSTEPQSDNGDKAADTAPFRALHRFDNDTRLMVRAYAYQSQQIFCYGLQFLGTFDADYFQWYEGMRELDGKMHKQALAMGVDKELGDILYASLDGVSVTANQDVFGRKSGEELVDLFCVRAAHYQFTYPEGELVALDENGFEVGEWIECEYMCTKYLSLYLKPGLDFTELIGNIKITIKTTFNDTTLSTDVTYKNISMYE